MYKSVILNLGKGSLEDGFSSVTALLESDSQRMQVTGSLSPAPKLIDIYHRWQLLYNLIYQSRALGLRSYKSSISIDETGITNVSDVDFTDVCQELQNCLNNWLDDSNFRSIQHQLRNQLNPEDEIRFTIQTQNCQIIQIPWYIWQFFQDYPHAEVSLSSLNCQWAKKEKTHHKKVRILAILGDTEGIDVAADRLLLENLAHADTIFLVQPTCQKLNEQLWSRQGWDILFFAGHSSTEEQKGKLALNPDECITLTQLKNALQKAIARGLQLAIFNSCEGLGLARHLSDLNIPQTIVMREPVPDRVAQEFLKHFLTGFAGGQPFYIAVREAREKLQGIELEFPGASWLPVVFQNPATATPTWKQLRKNSSDRLQKYPHLKIARVFLGSLVTTTLITGLRWQGNLQAIELKAFDHFTRLMPEATVDERLLIIGADEKDINSEGYGYPLPDRVLGQVVQKLEQYRPAAIGIDIFRDSPILLENSPENQAFTTLLQQNSHTVTVCTGNDAENSVAPPVGSPPERVGFADLYQDLTLTNNSDYTVRRYLLSRTPNPIAPESRCTTPYSFALQLAHRYFQNHKIPVTTVGENWQIGSTVIKRLQNRSGGYQNFDERGNQLLIRYRNTPHIARQVTVRELLADDGNFDPAWVKDRIVLIGVTAATIPDLHDTPRGKLRGLHVHAHVLSQILDIVEAENSALFWWLPPWGDLFWLWFWSFTGGIIVLVWQSPIQQGVAMSGSAIALYGVCWFFFTKNGWLPLVPGALALLLTGSGLIIYAFLVQKYEQKETSKENML
jgi:CHASE2 domain-containing sensor protein